MDAAKGLEKEQVLGGYRHSKRSEASREVKARHDKKR